MKVYGYTAIQVVVCTNLEKNGTSSGGVGKNVVVSFQCKSNHVIEIIALIAARSEID